MSQNELKEIQSNLKLQGERIRVLESRVPNYPKLRVPDYSYDLRAVKQSLNTFLNSNHQKNMDQSMSDIKELVSRIPHVIPVQHHHHFAKLTKRVIIVFLILILLLAFASWLAYYFYNH